MKTPPLLQMMLETSVGDLVVRESSIFEPQTDCCIAKNFPSREEAIAAAREMNDVADWLGLIKVRAKGGRPNCQDELERLAEMHGGKLAHDANSSTIKRCSEVAARAEAKS